MTSGAEENLLEVRTAAAAKPRNPSELKSIPVRVSNMKLSSSPCRVLNLCPIQARKGPEFFGELVNSVDKESVGGSIVRVVPLGAFMPPQMKFDRVTP